MKEEIITNRAWVSLNLDNLEHNVKEINKYLSKKTKIMAVLKANAYGHDLVIIGKKLNEIGVFDFAVATLEEGIKLRENNVSGNILILGYTRPDLVKYVVKYDLIQTIVDEEYAKKIMALPLKKVKVHLKINTGMNRIGINSNNVLFIKSLYTDNNNLDIMGLYSHLCSSTSNDLEDVNFTKLQINRFNQVLGYLKSNNINAGKTHLQSSYGFLNYNELEYDYVRIGILIYGNYNDNDTYAKLHLDLKPVLSLHARIVSVRDIEKGEIVGYSRTYEAKQKERIAAVSIGYVDGYPRSVGDAFVYVKVNGQYALVIGRICMDQIVINVTGIPNVKEGDIVTLIGEDKEISAENISSKLKTISPELFGRLGHRLNYVIKEKD